MPDDSNAVLTQFERQLTQMAERIQRQSEQSLDRLQRDMLRLAERQLEQMVQQTVEQWLKQSGFGGGGAASAGSFLEGLFGGSQPVSGQERSASEQARWQQFRRNQ